MNYFDLLDNIHRSYRPRTYLEIGVFRGQSTQLALDGTTTIGVDPKPSVIYPLSSETTLHRLTSDDFFTSRAENVIGSTPVDLTFIDGMHLFEFALRDFLNTERFTGPESVVLIHDVLPQAAVQAERDRTTGIWTGDVWKFLLYLREFRPELKTIVADIAPTGLLAVSGFGGEVPTGAADITKIADRYGDLTYSDFERLRDEDLHVAESGLEVFAALLPSRPWQGLARIDVLVAARAARRRDLGTVARQVRHSDILRRPRKLLYPLVAPLLRRHNA